MFNLFNKRVTPQQHPIPGTNQIQNNAGGFVWELDSWAKLNRLLILGTEGGTFYVSERELTLKNAKNALDCLQEDYQRFVDTIVDVSVNGKAYKNDPALFCLALAAASDHADARIYALAALPKVARIGTHLFHFVEYVDGMRGWGRSLRRHIGNWYTQRSEESLALQLAKYQQRDGWSHRDLLRLAHTVPTSAQQQALFRWAVGRDVELEQLTGQVKALELLKSVNDESEVIEIIKEYGAPREIIPTEYLTSAHVWEAMVPSLGLTALIRNLGNLSKIEWLVEDKASAGMVAERITDREALRKARIHPLQILAALTTYQSGSGARGKGQWTVCPSVIKALNEAFYQCFENIIPAEKRIYIGLDVSGSMAGGWVSGIPGLSPRIASAALALATMHTEPQVIIRGFQGNMVPLQLNANMSIEDVVHKISGLPFGRTDCAQPMLDAMKNNIKADAFVIYTDNETWAGNIHPAQALQQYRQKFNIPAKLVVVGMTSNGFSIADPNDAGMLDVVGFSTDTPAVISDFIAGRI
jgi:60 kDa SS-A/Ro ribonucleoprotein